MNYHDKRKYNSEMVGKEIHTIRKVYRMNCVRMPVYEAYKKAKNKEQFCAAHESDLILYEAAAKALRAANVGGKLPSVAALQIEYAKLTEQKEALYTDYGKLKKQVKEYDTMKQNIDSFLKIERTKKKQKTNELQ